GRATRATSTRNGARAADRPLDGSRADFAGGGGMMTPRVIAHRGSSAAHPDNSWAALEAAVTEGADTIECDVVATCDAVPVSLAGAGGLLLIGQAYRGDHIHLCREMRATSPQRRLDVALIQKLRRASLGVTLWHEEREDELRALVALEPEAICTNTPAVLRRI